MITISELSEDLQIVEKKVHDDQKLPIYLDHANVLHMFKLTTISADIFKNRIMIEINVPTIEVEHFTIYEIILTEKLI